MSSLAARHKRRRSCTDLTPVKRPVSPVESLPAGTDCLSFARHQPGPSFEQAPASSHADALRPASARRLTFAEQIARPPTTMEVTDSGNFEPIVQGMAEEMTSLFGVVSDAFDRLKEFKVTVTEHSDKFAKFPLDKRIEKIKTYPLDYCRELLEQEVLSNQRLEERMKLVSKRNYDLERRLEFVETNVERVQQEALDKAEHAISKLISSFSVQEANLLAARQREAQAASVLRMSNKSLESARVALEETVKRLNGEVQELRSEVKRISTSQKATENERDSLDEKWNTARMKEKDLSSALSQCEHTLSSTREELQRANGELAEMKRENRRMVAEAQSVSEKYRQDALKHRNQLEGEWQSMKERMERDREMETTDNQRVIDSLTRERNNARAQTTRALEKITSLEADREAWQRRTAENLYRSLMVKYRDMVQEFHYDDFVRDVPKENREVQVNVEESMRREREQRNEERPDKKKQLTRVLTKVVAKMDSGRRK